MLCGQCFSEIAGADVCPVCGFDNAQQRTKYPVALRPGAILNGQYVVGRVLGQGGFGITYLAMDDRTKTRVAIKEYYPAEFAGRAQGGTMIQVLSGNREENFAYGKEQFLEEARTLAAVRGDEHIVRIYSYFEENGTAYFAMEYVQGVPLDKFLRERGGQLTAAEAENLFLPLMAALETVHKKGIVHRDIAPDNIIVTKDGTAKLIDFGAARYSTGEKSKSLDVILKHGFAPMEQYTRRGRQGPWTDVYALAATYYYAVTGRVPPDAIERVAEDTIQTPGSLGVRLGAGTEAVLMKALAVQAAERWQNMGEFRGALLTAAQWAESAEKERREKEAAERAEAERRAREAKEREEAARREKKTAKSGAGRKKLLLPAILAAAVLLALGAFGGARLLAKPAPTPTEPPAFEVRVSDGVAYHVYEDHAEVSSIDRSAREVEIAAECEGKPVTEIQTEAARYCRELTKITIPGSVIGIGSNAFLNCDNLQEVVIREGVREIGSLAFSQCISLEQITLPEGLATLDSGVFERCSGLKIVELPQSLMRIGANCFTGCALTEVSIPGGVASFGTNIFCDCNNLKSVAIGEGVTCIGKAAFWSCDSLEHVELPDSVTTIEEMAFHDCEKLESVRLSANLTRIEADAFSGCRALQQIDLPEGLTWIGEGAFFGCELLTERTLPESLTNIGQSAFEYAKALKQITVPGGVRRVGDSAFSACEALTDLVLEEGVEEVGDHAFSSCGRLQNVSFPESLERIGESAFMGCEKLSDLALPSGLKQIKDNAFLACSGLRSVTIPESVTEIGDSAFGSIFYLREIHAKAGSYAAEFYRDDPLLVIDE